MHLGEANQLRLSAPCNQDAKMMLCLEIVIGTLLEGCLIHAIEQRSKHRTRQRQGFLGVGCPCFGTSQGFFSCCFDSRHRNNIAAFKSLGQHFVPGMQTCLVSEWTDSQCAGSGVSGCSAADAPALARGTLIHMLCRLESNVSANFMSVQTSNKCHHHNHIPTF